MVAPMGTSVENLGCILLCKSNRLEKHLPVSSCQIQKSAMVKSKVLGAVKASSCLIMSFMSHLTDNKNTAVTACLS